jgi:hypothetical protein
MDGMPWSLGWTENVTSSFIKSLKDNYHIVVPDRLSDVAKDRLLRDGWRFFKYFEQREHAGPGYKSTWYSIWLKRKRTGPLVLQDGGQETDSTELETPVP